MWRHPAPWPRPSLPFGFPYRSPRACFAAHNKQVAFIVHGADESHRRKEAGGVERQPIRRERIDVIFGARRPRAIHPSPPVGSPSAGLPSVGPPSVGPRPNERRGGTERFRPDSSRWPTSNSTTKHTKN